MCLPEGFLAKPACERARSFCVDELCPSYHVDRLRGRENRQLALCPKQKPPKGGYPQHTLSIDPMSRVTTNANSAPIRELSFSFANRIPIMESGSLRSCYTAIPDSLPPSPVFGLLFRGKPVKPYPSIQLVHRRAASRMSHANSASKYDRRVRWRILSTYSGFSADDSMMRPSTTGSTGACASKYSARVSDKSHPES